MEALHVNYLRRHEAKKLNYMLECIRYAKKKKKKKKEYTVFEGDAKTTRQTPIVTEIVQIPRNDFLLINVTDSNGVDIHQHVFLFPVLIRLFNDQDGLSPSSIQNF